MKIGQKVFVCDWGKYYSDIYRWVDNDRQLIWNWKTKLPPYPHLKHEYIYEPNLTLKGTVNKINPRTLVAEIPIYKNFEYTIEEITTRQDGQLIYLLSSEEGTWVQIGAGGITTLTPEDQEKVKHLEQEKWLQAMAKENLGKWDITVKKSEFPKELLKYLYDKDQRTCFGSDSPNTRAIIRYPYISKEYTKNGNDILLGWVQEYNGTGCDLSDKETITWNELKIRFPENTFEN